MATNSSLGIWGNEDCEKCGACCYDYNRNSLCRNQEIRDRKSYCRIHDDQKRDPLCQVWHCRDLNNLLNYANKEKIKQEFRDIAVNILETRPLVC